MWNYVILFEYSKDFVRTFFCMICGEFLFLCSVVQCFTYIFFPQILRWPPIPYFVYIDIKIQNPIILLNVYLPSVLGRSVGRRLVGQSVSGSNVRSVIISSRRKGREVTLSGLIRMLIFYLEILMVQIKDPACSATTIYNQGQQGQAGKVVHFCESKLTFNRVTYWVMT